MAQRIVLLLPVYNESDTILEVLDKSEPFVDQILVVDDGSTDRTQDLLHAYAAAHPKLFFVSHQTNRGMSGALLTGFLILDEARQRGRLERDDLVVTMDSDGQHDAVDILKLTEPISQGRVDMVVGKRSFEAYPMVKRAGNWFLTRWATLWSGFRYQDVECGFRSMSVRVMADFLPYFNPVSYGCAQEMSVIVSRRGWRVSNDVPIHVARYRAGAKVRHGFNNALAAVRAWDRVRRDRPVERQAWPTQLLPYDSEAYRQRYE